MIFDESYQSAEKERVRGNDCIILQHFNDRIQEANRSQKVTKTMQNIGNTQHTVLENAQEGIYNSYNLITKHGQIYQDIPFYSGTCKERWNGDNAAAYW